MQMESFKRKNKTILYYIKLKLEIKKNLNLLFNPYITNQLSANSESTASEAVALPIGYEVA